MKMMEKINLQKVKKFNKQLKNNKIKLTNLFKNKSNCLIKNYLVNNNIIILKKINKKKNSLHSHNKNLKNNQHQHI